LGHPELGAVSFVIDYGTVGKRLPVDHFATDGVPDPGTTDTHRDGFAKKHVIAVHLTALFVKDTTAAHPLRPLGA
jgi:hypothetical protein